MADDGYATVLLASRATLAPDKNTVVYGFGNIEVPSSANRKVQFNPNGSIQAAGAVIGNSTFTDYAEFFENLTSGVISLGSMVALEGDRIRLAEIGDDILGIVSASLIDTEGGGKQFSGTAFVVAGNNPFSWSKRYLTGEFGEVLYQTILDPDWRAEIPDGNWSPMEGQTEADRPMVPNPISASTITIPIENPEFDIHRDNVPRSERPEEWTCVGLLGQLHVRVDDTVKVGSYVQAKQGGIGTSSAQKTNLRCMRIKLVFDQGKGYAVAFCVLK